MQENRRNDVVNLNVSDEKPTRKEVLGSGASDSKTNLGGSDELLQDRDIEYQFISFHTTVATQPVWPEGVAREAPPFPDLTKYESPFEWSPVRKKLITCLACSVNGVAAYAAGSYESAADQLEQKWHVSVAAYNVGIAIFTVGFGIAPMVLAPFSEINGRRPVFISSGLLFVVCQIWCSLANNYASMILARFFLGMGASTFSIMVGGILADIWETKDRNTPMTIFTGATLFGTGLGPLVSGFVAQHLLWRWVFYIQIIIAGVFVLLVTVFFTETRGSILLARKAKALNKWFEELEKAGALGLIIPDSTDQRSTGGISIVADSEKSLSQVTDGRRHRLRYRCKEEENRASIAKMISLSLYRPMHMLVTEPVVFWFSIWISFCWSILYLQFSSIPIVFEQSYKFTLEQTGAVFTSICVSSILMTALSIWQDHWAKKRYPQYFASGAPEGRLYFTCVESALMPIGLFMFGWTSYPTVHWVVPAIAVGIATMGIFSIFLAVFNYSADVYRIYASSALAASGLCRNLMAGSFPLVARPLFDNLGFQAAGSLLGGIGLALTAVPWVLVLFGPKIRRRSRIARNFVEEDEKRT